VNDMGFDLSGLNPNLTRPEPELPPMVDRTSKHWEIYTEWEKENCGVHFRNSSWGWRPLWGFVTGCCDDILTEKDIKNGTHNGGQEISKTKASRMAKRLFSLIKKGQVEAYEEIYIAHLNSLEQVDCDICDATGKRQEPPKIGAGDMKCNGCSGTGKRDHRAKSYPFSEDNVRQFANFCANSGGFRIC
jgi:hypothetical protein